MGEHAPDDLMAVFESVSILGHVSVHSYPRYLVLHPRIEYK